MMKFWRWLYIGMNDWLGLIGGLGGRPGRNKERSLETFNINTRPSHTGVGFVVGFCIFFWELRTVTVVGPAVADCRGVAQPLAGEEG